MAHDKGQRVPLPTQGELLCRVMPGSKFTLQRDELRWWGWVTPSLISLTYKVRLTYRIGRRPAVQVMDPLLTTLPNVTLPHTYDGEELCLYFPDGKEWHDGMLLAHRVLPWISEWLYHYEIWLVTKQWNGGGIH